MNRCPVCSSPRVENAAYCPSCGSRINQDQRIETYRCWIHKDRFGLYRCEVCGKLICKECRYEYSSRHICKICYISVVLPSRFVTRFQQRTAFRGDFSTEDGGLILVGGGGKPIRHIKRSGDL
ncbi:MAG: hypothetical protein RMJ28_02910 [Nitrososphaerota archaeon]|nr:hypothetical protein [Candidatus Calditenuaceae archaeon]MDW8073170.1 hypothetical protein [Nitrososphaerota archaeon]